MIGPPDTSGNETTRGEDRLDRGSIPRKAGLQPGEVVAGRYEVMRPVGRGGMGVVYEVREAATGERFALKTILPVYASKPKALERFLQEASTAQRLQHPNIVRVCDVGQDGAMPYIVTEFLTGQSLRDAMKEWGPLDLPTAVALLRQLCDALEYAHQYMVHRDLSPENVFLLANTNVKLLDFGLARTADRGTMTVTGAALGKPHYMSPEQRRDSAHVDARTDIYALGVMFFEMLTGQLPLGVSKAADLKPELPAACDDLIGRCLAPLDKRIDSVHDVRDGLDQCLAAHRVGENEFADIVWAQTRTRRQRRNRALSLLVVLAFLAAYISLTTPWFLIWTGMAPGYGTVSGMRTPSGAFSVREFKALLIGVSALLAAACLLRINREYWSSRGIRDRTFVWAQRLGFIALARGARKNLKLVLSLAVVAGIVLSALAGGLSWLRSEKQLQKEREVARLQEQAARRNEEGRRLMKEAMSAYSDILGREAGPPANEADFAKRRDAIEEYINRFGSTKHCIDDARRHLSRYAKLNPPTEEGQDYSVDLGGGQSLQMVWIKPGTFMMGSLPNERGHQDDETQHKVTLSRGFWISKYTMTERQLVPIVNLRRHAVPGDTPERLSWSEAQVFLQWLNLKGGGGFRLSTEAEWEYVFRAGRTSPYFDKSMTDLHESDLLRQPNPWNVYKMLSDDGEWCRDWYGPFTSHAVVDPAGPPNGDQRACRGRRSISDGRFARRDTANPGEGSRYLRLCYAPSSTPPETGGDTIASATKAAEDTDALATAPPTATPVSTPPDIPRKPRTFSGIEMVWCPPGTFLMGSPPKEKGRQTYETQHKVTLTKGFWLGKYEVTQEQWEKVMGNNPSHFKGDKRPPVENVSWNSCQAFIEKLNSQEEGGFRLPSEAEWEYACRAGTTTPNFWGKGKADGCAWCLSNSNKETHPVGQKQPNAWGLYDICGNVGEFCQDCFAPYPEHEEIDPIGPLTGLTRVVRGSDWTYAAASRSAWRDKENPVRASSRIGLRLAHD